LKAAVTWYMARSEISAQRFLEEIDRAVELVLDAPKRWPTHDHNTRKFALQRFPFAIVYRETENAVLILAIAHGHREPEYWKLRL